MVALRIRVAIVIRGVADRGTSYKYTYDHNNRLIEIDDDTGTTRKAAFTYDALGRRIEHVNDVTGDTMRYFYDGVNPMTARPSRAGEIVVYDGSGNRSRFYIHGISYVDERLMTCPLCREAVSRVHDETNDRPEWHCRLCGKDLHRFLLQ